MSKPNRSFINQFCTEYPNDDDGEIYNRFNSFLSSLVAKYQLNTSDIQKLCEMFKDGANFEQIEQMAMDLERQHQEQYAEACQRIANEKAGGVGEYHGFRGREEDFEMFR